MKRFFLVFTILFCAAVVAMIGWVVYVAYFEEKGSLRHVQRIAGQLNAVGDTRESFELTATAHSDRSLTLRYEMFDLYAEDVDEAGKRAVRERLRTHACTDKGLRELLDAGVMLRVVIVDGDDAPILSTELLRWECGGVATAGSSR